MSDTKAFAGQKYLNLETVRKNGTPVQTPVWFFEENGILYVRTHADSGKVKRARNNPQVRVVPCDVRGGVKGEWQPAVASIADEATHDHINQMLRKKYGLMKTIFSLLGPSRSEIKEVTLIIRPQ